MTEATEQLIAARAAKLERIKPLISLKSYDALAEKLLDEALSVRGQADRQQKRTEARELPQSLPKAHFEQRHLPRKAIRID